jgi:DNA-binding response OmpR family regulator
MQEELPILLFEDSDNDAQSILHAFRKAQVRNPIIHFSTGVDGLKYLFREFRRNRPVGAFLILGLTLPDLSGFEVLRWLRKNPVGRKMPVILLTDAPQEGDHFTGELLGAEVVHSKNLNFENLCGIIHKLGGYWLLRTSASREKKQQL